MPYSLRAEQDDDGRGHRRRRCVGCPLDAAFELFRSELAAADPVYAAGIKLETLSADTFGEAYFAARDALVEQGVVAKGRGRGGSVYRVVAEDGAGGRLFSFGVSSMNNAKSIFGKLKVLLQFGIYHPLQFLSNSRGMVGVNMLKIAEDDPIKIAKAMKEVVSLTEAGTLNPHVGGEYTIDQLAEAHRFLESRKSMGKIVVKW